MPLSAEASQIGRPVARPLEIEVFEKFKKYESKFTAEKAAQNPHLVRPAPSIGQAGNGCVNWVGLNPDPCKAKYLEKQGIIPGMPKKVEHKPEPKIKRKTDMYSIPLQTAPPTGAPSRAPTAVGTGLLTRVESAPPATAMTSMTDATQRTSQSSLHSRASIKSLVEKAVSHQLQKLTRPLDDMSSHEHYIEQKLRVGERPPLSRFGNFRPSTDKLPDDLRELIYYGVSANQQGRRAYLEHRSRIMPQDKLERPEKDADNIGWDCYAGPGKFVGSQLKPFSPRRAQVAIM
mmetsp:Transcript_6783/g.12036  ORF Transcript_6783/g.12036 Transcript_6783/m.12036 type:complete len:289 (+) Transcript_6783:115-981(+)